MTPVVGLTGPVDFDFVSKMVGGKKTLKEGSCYGTDGRSYSYLDC